MKIGICVRDPLLQRALVDLLRAEGHEAVTPELGLEDCRLRIISEQEIDGGVLPDCATLILAHHAEVKSKDPRGELEAALESGGLCTWSPPLNASLLLSVVGTGGDRARAPVEAPDLSDAPHPWMLVDPNASRLIAANAEACGMLDIDAGGCPLTDLAIPGALREGLAERSEGIFPLQNVDGGRWAVWWTDRSGRRVVCLMHVPGEHSADTRHQHLLAEIGRMTSTLAHEIRNPIASIAGAFELLESESDPTDRKEILDMARERLSQMSQLLEKTLLLARPIDEPPEFVALQPLIDSVVDSIRLDPRFAGIAIEASYPEDAVHVRAHAQPLQGALGNVLINAAQAQDGEGTIDVTLEVDSRRAMIRVRDAGPGVPPERREEVFRPFYTTKEAGTGLGLAEVRRAIEAAGGAISLEEVDEGACFRMELPLVRS